MPARANLPAVVAVRMEDLGAALGRLDEDSRTFLDLSVRRGVPDEEDADRRRAELLERLANELGLATREERDELFATLQDLPESLWGFPGGRDPH
jgi:hypothetical protein